MRGAAPSPAPWRSPVAGIPWFMAVLLLQLALTFLLLGSWHTLTGEDGVSRAGNPIGADFNRYYAVSTATLRRMPEVAYDPTRLFEIEAETVEDWRHSWSYPPSALLFVWPLATMPYFAALAVWLLATLALLLAVCWRTAPHPWAPVLVLLFPAVGLSIFSGQNGCLSAALLAGALTFLREKPWLAGLCLGLLTYKPSLGLLIPVALLAAGHWRVMFWAVGATLLFCLASLLAFGVEPWLAYPKSFAFMRLQLTDPALVYFPVPTPYAQAKLWGLPQAVTDGVHIAGLVAAAVFVSWLWRGPARFEVRRRG